MVCVALISALTETLGGRSYNDHAATWVKKGEWMMDGTWGDDGTFIRGIDRRRSIILRALGPWDFVRLTLYTNYSCDAQTEEWS